MKKEKDQRNRVIQEEWCENFIRHLFGKIAKDVGCGIREAGIEVNCFWDRAERSGLWERGTYHTPMSGALERLVKVEAVHNEAGEYCYTVFRMA